tara:strand:+ start:10054 stop:11187 length:1134 start_codon:yes stop_codon:yes gene_type:complete
MKITFYSNFLNHHQISFCNEMYDALGSRFTFVSTMKTPQWLLDSGYYNFENEEFNLLAHENNENYRHALELSISSDIVIIGSAPELYVKERLKHNKHTFRFSERLIKNLKLNFFSPRNISQLFKKHTLYRNKNLYMLCASGFTSKDCKVFFSYPKKKYKWGYFLAKSKFNIEDLIANKPNKRIELIWVARFLDWKHPELAIKLVYELRQKGFDIYLKMIGSGPLLKSSKELANKLDIQNFISFIGNLQNKDVLKLMKMSNIFLFTSDRNEGWGVVLNEAIMCGCAIVASNKIGSVPYLINNNENGLIFQSNSINDLTEKVIRLINDKNLRESLSRNAFNYVNNNWCAENASKAFLTLSKSILQNEKNIIISGPCSPA